MDRQSYAEWLSTIGDTIKRCTNIPAFDISSKEKAKEVIHKYKKRVAELNGVISEMKDVHPPVNVELEHNELIEETRDWVNGLRSVWGSLDADTLTINKVQYNLGNNIIDKSIRCILDIISRMANKI